MATTRSLSLAKKKTSTTAAKPVKKVKAAPYTKQPVEKRYKFTTGDIQEYTLDGGNTWRRHGTIVGRNDREQAVATVDAYRVDHSRQVRYRIVRVKYE